MKTFATLAVGFMVLLAATPSHAEIVVDDGTVESFSTAVDDATSSGDSILVTTPIVIDSDNEFDGGSGIVVSGGSSNSIFQIESGNVSFTAFTFENGFSTNGGGAMFISPDATVALTDCIFANNIAAGTNGISAGTNVTSGSTVGSNGGKGTSADNGLGGAIYNLGDLSVFNCQFITNRAQGGTGGDGGPGGNGTLQAGNGGSAGNGGAALGGGIYSEGTLAVEDSTFAGNSATGGDGGTGGAAGTGFMLASAGAGGVGGLARGAGIYTIQSDTDVTILNCTFSDNIAQGGNSADGGSGFGGKLGNGGKSGGEALGGGICNFGSLLMTNSTLFENKALGGAGGAGGSGALRSGNGGNGGVGAGGGIYNTGTVVVANCTFAMGSALGGQNGAAGSGQVGGKSGKSGKSYGGNLANFANKKNKFAFTLQNSIVGTNTSGGGGYGKIVDGGNNISADNSIKLKKAKYKNTKTDPKLGPLADNGGPTLTMAIGTNSPAWNKIVPTADTPTLDQRGAPRPEPDGSLSDIGAYEFQPSTITIHSMAAQPAFQIPPSYLTNGLVVQTNNGTVTLTVSAIADPPISYRWYGTTNGVTGLVQSTLRSPSSVNSLVLTNLSTNNVGLYYVVVSNAVSLPVTSPSIFVTNANGALIITQPTNQVVAHGATAMFSVTVTGDLPLFYQWQFNSTNITDATNANLFIANAQSTNIGSYTVSVTNRFGSAFSTAATLNLLPFITVQPADQVVTVGDDVTFTVTADGSGPLSYTWFFNGAAISGAIAPSYSQSSVQTNRTGSYEVTVGNSFGTINSRVAMLTINSAPLPQGLVKIQPASAPSAPLPVPMLRNVGLNVKTFTFAFPSSTGITYKVQYKDEISGTNWIPLLTNVGTGEWITNEIPMTNATSRFFRVRVQ